MTTRRILITGCAGFIGSNVLCHLYHKYPSYEFVGLDRLDPCASMQNMAEVMNDDKDLNNSNHTESKAQDKSDNSSKTHKRFHFVQGDIQSADLVRHLLIEYRIDTVLHFAACSWVDASFGNSIQFTQSNIVGTHVLLECCKSINEEARALQAQTLRSETLRSDQVQTLGSVYYDSYGNELPNYTTITKEELETPQACQATLPIQRFIHVSTDECYAQVDPHSDYLHPEHGLLDPQNPYAATKCAAEFIVKSYHHSFGLPVIITRSSNVIGPKQYVEKLISKSSLLLSQGRAIPLHGNGLHRRSYLYIDDVSAAFDVILHQGQTGETYNIGNDAEISNLDTARLLIQLVRQYYPQCIDPVKPDTDYITFVKDRAINDFRYRIASDKLRALGWRQQVTEFRDMFKRTLDWYMTHKDYWPDCEYALQAHPTAGKR